jgi:hypothetical protein
MSSRASSVVAVVLSASAMSVSSGAAGHHDNGIATCRTLATELTAQFSGPGGFTGTARTSCTFNAPMNQSTCTSQYSDNRGTSSTSTSTSTYKSIADVIDEIAVIPPLNYVLTTAATQTGNRGNSSGGVTNTFDGSRRMTKTVNTSANGDSTTTYTAWDASGRPTAAADVGKGFSNTRAISYDDVARTRTTVVNGGPLRTVETFDADGNQIEALTASGGSSFTSKTAISVSASQRVCK